MARKPKVFEVEIGSISADWKVFAFPERSGGRWVSLVVRRVLPNGRLARTTSAESPKRSFWVGHNGDRAAGTHDGWIMAKHYPGMVPVLGRIVSNYLAEQMLAN